jgi:hypothetical protein
LHKKGFGEEKSSLKGTKSGARQQLYFRSSAAAMQCCRGFAEKVVNFNTEIIKP